MTCSGVLRDDARRTRAVRAHRRRAMGRCLARECRGAARGLGGGRRTRVPPLDAADRGAIDTLPGSGTRPCGEPRVDAAGGRPPTRCDQRRDRRSATRTVVATAVVEDGLANWPVSAGGVFDGPGNATQWCTEHRGSSPRSRAFRSIPCSTRSFSPVESSPGRRPTGEGRGSLSRHRGQRPRVPRPLLAHR